MTQVTSFSREPDVPVAAGLSSKRRQIAKWGLEASASHGSCMVAEHEWRAYIYSVQRISLAVSGPTTAFLSEDGMVALASETGILPPMISALR
jgi:hypothetical protein